jgi:hypothetical protein
VTQLDIGLCRCFRQETNAVGVDLYVLIDYVPIGSSDNTADFAARDISNEYLILLSRSDIATSFPLHVPELGIMATS